MKRIIVLSLMVIYISGCVKESIKPKKRSYYRYIDKQHLRELKFSQDNLATLKVGSSWYYVRKDGKALLVMEEKGEPDRFKEGFARTKQNGKIGFFNRNLDIIIEPLYDFAFPFHNGISEVCIGCRDLKYYGEDLLDGGEWKRINRKGIIIEE
jgi:hypothetical protein